MSDQIKDMTLVREADILEGAIKKFGIRPQVIVAIEELAELQKELTKYLRAGYVSEVHKDYSNILEEMADVSIMLNQLELIFGDPIEEEIAKLERLEGLVQDDGD